MPDATLMNLDNLRISRDLLLQFFSCFHVSSMHSRTQVLFKPVEVGRRHLRLIRTGMPLLTRLRICSQKGTTLTSTRHANTF